MTDNKEKPKAKKVVRRRAISGSSKENTGKLGVFNNYAGQFVSLNMKQTTYFGLGQTDTGQNKLWLSSDNWCDKVPESLTDQETMLLSQAIQQGKVVMGKKWLPALKKDTEVKTKYVGLLRQYRSCTDQFKNHIRAIVLKKHEGNYTPTEIVRAMLAAENAAGARTDFLVFLKDALSHCTGPVSLVEDFPTDPENYSVTIDPVSMQIIDTTKKRKAEAEVIASVPSGPLDDPEERSAKIESAFD